MTLQFPIRVHQTSTTTGQGTLNLTAASSNLRNFHDFFANNSKVNYVISDPANNYEVGVGTLVIGAPDTLSRDAIIVSSNGNVAVNWGVGTRDVFALTLPSSPGITFASNITIDPSDYGNTYIFNGISTATFTLAQLSTLAGNFPINVKNSGGGTVTIAANASDPIEGSLTGASLPLFPGQAISLVKVGITWRIAVPPARSTAGGNLLINPEHRIDQRNEGASVALPTASGPFMISDQWHVNFIGAATGLTAQQVAGPTGYPNAIKVTVGTGSGTVNAGDILQISQNIESRRLTDLQYGTANAVPLSMSFLMNSSINGLYGVRLCNVGTNNRSYVTAVGLLANTWTSIVIPAIVGDVTGTWPVSSTNGLQVLIALMSGTTFQTATTNSWITGDLVTTALQTQLTITTGATFQMTAAMLTRDVANPYYERREVLSDYALCQTYYEKSYDRGTTAGTVTTNGSSNAFLAGLGSASYTGSGRASYRTPKRIVPAVTLYSTVTGTASKVRDVTNSADVTPTVILSGMNSFAWTAVVNAAVTAVNLQGQWVAEAGF